MRLQYWLPQAGPEVEKEIGSTQHCRGVWRHAPPEKSLNIREKRGKLCIITSSGQEVLSLHSGNTACKLDSCVHGCTGLGQPPSRKMYIASLNTSLPKSPKNGPFCLYMLLCMTTSIKRTCGPSYLKQSKIKQYSRPRDWVPRLNFLRALCTMSLQGAHERFGLGTKL